MSVKEEENDEYVVRVRGLPWSCTEQQLREFFREDGNVDRIISAHFTYNREGRPSGEAYLKFSDEISYLGALKKDKEYLNKRYVEVFPSKQAEMEYVVKHSSKSSSYGGEANDDAVVRMRGLPYGCTKEEIATFFLGLEIVPNGIMLLSDSYTGRATGESFVQFTGREVAEKALQKHMQKIGHRYIEVFRSSAEEMRRFMRRSGMNGSGSAGGGGGGGGGAMNSMSYGAPTAYPDWATGGSAAASYYAASGGYPTSGYAAMSGASMGGSMMDPYGASSDMMYLNRSSMRPTPYDRPAAAYAQSRQRPTPLVASMSSQMGGAYASRGYTDGGRVGGSAGGSFKGGYAEGAYSSGGGASARGGGGAGGRAGRAGGSGHYVHMRGLPWSATEKDIVDFFSPLRIAGTEILYESNGRASGAANVEFYTPADAQEAMKHDKDMLGHRYVELFMNAPSSASSSVSNQMYEYREFAEHRM